MIDALSAFLHTTLIPLGPLGIFAGGFIEEVVAPIPSALVMLSSGFVFLKGAVTAEFVKTLIVTVVLPITLGITLGSFVIYFLFYFGGRPIIDTFGKFLGISWESVERLQERLKKHASDDVIIFGLRIVPIVPSIVINVFCGVIKYPFIRFALITFVGTFIRATILVLIGWKVGSVYGIYAEVLKQYESATFGVIGGIVLVYVLWKIYRRHV